MTAPGPRNRLSWLPGLLGFVAAVAVYAIALRNEYVYDDVLLLLQDDRVTDPSQWRRFWTESYNGGVDNLFRPLVSMSFALQARLHGLDRPAGFFAVNILLHAVCSALVGELARRMVGLWKPDRPDATLLGGITAGVLFAVHPVHAEAVASVVGRAETMCAAPALAAMVLLTRPLTLPRAVAIWACGVVSLLSKEQGLVLPLILAVQFSLFRPAGDRSGRLALLLLIAWTWAGYIVFRENLLRFAWDRSLLDWSQQPMIFSPSADRWLWWPLALLGRAAQLLVFPWRLTIDYGMNLTAPQVRPGDPYIAMGVAALLAWGGLLAWAWRRDHRPAVLALLGLAIAYGVVGNILTLIGTIFGERLLYLPSAFFVLLPGFAVAAIGWRPLPIVLVSLAAIAGAARTVTYVAGFDDRLAFYERSARENPDSVKIAILLGTEYTARRRYDEAAAAAARARRLVPDYHEPWYQSGLIEMERGRFEAAEEYAREAFRLSRNPTRASILLTEIQDRARAATRPAQ